MTPEGCGKQRFASERAAKTANEKARWRFRTYWCRPCAAWHVTNADREPRRKSRSLGDARKRYDRAEFRELEREEENDHGRRSA